LHVFINNLRNGKYFGGRKAVYILYVIEYQHRGLPHSHISIQLTDKPNSIEEKQLFMNEFIHARFPPAAELGNERYVELIKTNLLHKCSSAVNGCKKNINGKFIILL
jgi:hypothetical protein